MNGKSYPTTAPSSPKGAATNTQKQNKATTPSLTFDKDELPRADTSVEVLAGLKPAFHVAGSVTAGKSSPMSDGAAAAGGGGGKRGEGRGPEGRGAVLAGLGGGGAPGGGWNGATVRRFP